MKLGSAIKDVRDSCGFNQQYVADKAGLKRKASVSAIENEYRNPSFPTLESIAKTLHLNADQLLLLGLEPEKFPPEMISHIRDIQETLRHILGLANRS